MSVCNDSTNPESDTDRWFFCKFCMAVFQEKKEAIIHQKSHSSNSKLLYGLPGSYPRKITVQKEFKEVDDSLDDIEDNDQSVIINDLLQNKPLKSNKQSSAPDGPLPMTYYLKRKMPVNLESNRSVEEKLPKGNFKELEPKSESGIQEKNCSISFGTDDDDVIVLSSDEN